MSFFTTDEFSLRVTKITSRSHELRDYLSIFNLFKLMAILSKACKPAYFESHNSLKLSFMNIRGLCSNFLDCKSFLE